MNKPYYIKEMSVDAAYDEGYKNGLNDGKHEKCTGCNIPEEIIDKKISDVLDEVLDLFGIEDEDIYAKEIIEDYISKRNTEAQN